MYPPILNFPALRSSQLDSLGFLLWGGSMAKAVFGRNVTSHLQGLSSGLRVDVSGVFFRVFFQFFFRVFVFGEFRVFLVVSYSRCNPPPAPPPPPPM